MSVERIEVVAVVNHLGERMLINREDYLRGQWELWQEELEPKGEPTVESSKDRRRRRGG